MHTTVSSAFRLGEWLVEPTLNRLSCEGTVVLLEPKLMDLLVLLATCPGRVVAKSEILDGVWARRIVSESALSRVIAELRRALGDDAKSPRYIETIHKRGYRVVAAVEPANRTTDPREGAAPSLAEPRSGGMTPFVLIWGQHTVPLTEGETLIGRDPMAQVRIASRKVSRRHARIVVVGARAVIEDLDSRNGTYLRGRRVLAATELGDGDDVCIGAEVLTVRLCFPDGSTEAEGSLP